MKFQGLVIGRIVRFVNLDGIVLPAVVVEVSDSDNGIVSLGVFGLEYQFRNNTPYSEFAEMNTWHWPPSTAR